MLLRMWINTDYQIITELLHKLHDYQQILRNQVTMFCIGKLASQSQVISILSEFDFKCL